MKTLFIAYVRGNDTGSLLASAINKKETYAELYKRVMVKLEEKGNEFSITAITKLD